MKTLRQKLEQLSRAMEFANVDTYTEFNRLLEAHETAPQAKAAAAPCRTSTQKRPARRAFSYDHVIDFGTFAQRAALKTAGQH